MDFQEGIVLLEQGQGNEKGATAWKILWVCYTNIPEYRRIRLYWKETQQMFWHKKATQQDIYDALRNVVDNATGRNIVDMGWVSGAVLQDGHALVTLDVPADLGKERMQEMEILRQQAETVLQKIKSIRSARVILTAERKAAPQAKETPRAIAPFVKQIIAVASGKGGVGKSTVAANLALAFAQTGLSVGLLDADVYGPSVPMLFGVRDKKPAQENDFLIPVEAHGIKIMSMGFMVDEAAPMVWRGPMVQSALLQMLRDVRWGTAENPLDILVIDMPPGTGDTQLTIAQRVKLDGAVIVSTPQDIALLDTVKGITMFQKVSVPVLGVVENMSYFCCPHCGTETPVFGSHGARDRALELHVPFFGGVPLNAEIRRTSDEGKPIVLERSHHIAQVFSDISALVLKTLENTGHQKPAPKIIIEPAE